MTITITTDHAASSYGQPIIIIDGDIVDATAGVERVYAAIERIPITGFGGLPTTIGAINDPLPHIARAERAERRLSVLQDAIRSAAISSGLCCPEDIDCLSDDDYLRIVAQMA